MSTVPELQSRTTDVGHASLVTNTPDFEIEATRRLVHYLWFPYVDIPLVGPDGLTFRLGKGTNYYGVGRPGEDFGAMVANPAMRQKTPFAKPRPAESRAAETAEEYNARMGGWLMRCDAIPIWNVNYLESRFNHGNFTQEEFAAGNSLGADVELVTVDVAAGVCAADFLDRYETSHGARVLTPLIGMDGDEMKTAIELVKMVQPKAYKLTNIREEAELGEVQDEETLIFDLAERGPAHERIISAKLDKALAGKAHLLRQIMRAGVMMALTKARNDWEDLLQQLSNSAMGHAGYKKSVSAYDRQLAWLLGEAPPANVAMKPAGDPNMRKAVELLTQMAVSGNVGPKIDGDLITLSVTDLQAMVDRAVDARLSQSKKGKPQP